MHRDEMKVIAAAAVETAEGCLCCIAKTLAILERDLPVIPWVSFFVQAGQGEFNEEDLRERIPA